MSTRARPFPLLLALALVGCPVGAEAASTVVPVQAKPTKPLSLTRVQDLDLGTIALAPGTWSGASVTISRGGQLTCSNANVICTGAAKAATYTVTGSNNEVVKITAPNVVLTNQSNPAQTLTLVVDSAGTVTLESGGKKGTDFSLGGSITLSSSTGGGLYTGTFDVTVDY